MNHLLTRITQTPGQCGGRPCIRGMRIRVSDILEMLAENVSTNDILADLCPLCLCGEFSPPFNHIPPSL